MYAAFEEEHGRAKRVIVVHEPLKSSRARPASGAPSLPSNILGLFQPCICNIAPLTCALLAVEVEPLLLCADRMEDGRMRFPSTHVVSRIPTFAIHLYATHHDIARHALLSLFTLKTPLVRLRAAQTRCLTATYINFGRQMSFSQHVVSHFASG